MLTKNCFRPIPPLQALQSKDGVVVKPTADGLGWHTANDGVGWNIFCNQGTGADDGTIANGDASENDGLVADPHVAANDNVAFVVPSVANGCERQVPFLIENGEWIGG